MFKPVKPQVNFPEMEKEILSYWYTNGIVEKYLHRNDNSKKRFSFLDGPITANNPMGVHHAWGRTYKDLWQRFYNMRGFRQRFQNGFDCQGLWIEVEVEKELGIRTKRDIESLIPGDRTASIAKFVQLCKARVLKFSAIQTEQTKRLGNFMDWDHSYYTMSDENNYMIWHFLRVCYENGWIYKGKDSVPWCPRCETAISQHEMLTEDYKELTHKSIYMRLPLEGKINEFLLVWTTTPWTIPANIAVAVDVNYDYVLVADEKSDKYWLVKDVAERLFGVKGKVIKKIKGKELAGLHYRGAFDELEVVKKVSGNPKFHSVIPTDPLIMPITTTEGTGMVHTAVSAGEEDFKLGKKLELPMIPVIADNADYLPGLGFLSGKNAKKHPEIILDYMQEKGFAWKIENYTHRYPACWRCKTELVWKVAEEWYIAMDVRPLRIQNSCLAGRQAKFKIQNSNKKEKTLRERMMDVAKKIKWIPEFGLERELDWLKNMHDWLISKKNRYWGLALPIYDCKKCSHFEIIGGKEELKKRAVAGWSDFEGKSPHKPYIDRVKIKCRYCQEVVSRIDDVGNVWLDAGIVPFSTYIDPKSGKLSYITDKKYWREWFPANFITESFPGQFKNWFYSMIAMSTVLENTNPYQTVLGYASMLGEDGRPMHKSWGNAIEFNEGADKIGVDVMRWMFAIHDPEQNLLFGYKTSDETRRKFHLLLWNIYNFFVTYANVDGWAVGSKQLKMENVLDAWILSKLNSVISEVTVSLEKYQPFAAATALEDFVTDLSQWYIRRSRERIGPKADSPKDRNACYAALYTVLTTLSRLLAPFSPFLSEEMYRNLTGEESVHLANWPAVDKANINAALEKEMELGRYIVELAHSQRKAAGIKVRQPLAKLTYHAEKKIADEIAALIADEVNVKEVIYGGKEKAGPSLALDTTITDKLRLEGEARELIRTIQVKRKELGLGINDHVTIKIPQWEGKYPPVVIQKIKKETLADVITSGESFSIEKV